MGDSLFWWEPENPLNSLASSSFCEHPFSEEEEEGLSTSPSSPTLSPETRVLPVGQSFLRVTPQMML